MNLPPEAIKKFQNLYKADFGETIPKEEAHERLTRLVNLVKAVYYPNPHQNHTQANF